MNNNSHMFEEEIARVEETFLKLGANRMSEFFGIEIFNNGISSEHVLWVPTYDGYYFVKAKKEQTKLLIIVLYNADLDYGFEDFSQFEYTDNEKCLSEIINKILHRIHPKEESILRKYIDMDDSTVELDVTEINEEYPTDDNTSIILEEYLDPQRQSGVTADYVWRTYEENKPFKENDFTPIENLIDAFSGYWEAKDYNKTRAVALELIKETQILFPNNNYLKTWAETFNLISLYLTNDYVSVKNLGEKILADAEKIDNNLFIMLTVLDFLSSTYYLLGMDIRALQTADAAYQLTFKIYGDMDEQTIRAQLKCDLIKGVSESPKKAIEEARILYNLFSEAEGNYGENTIFTLSNLSSLLSKYGAYNQALLADTRLYKIFEQKYGNDDWMALCSLLNIALDISHTECLYPDADVIAKYAYNKAVLKYGPVSSEAATALSIRALISGKHGALGRAGLEQQKSYDIIQELYGPEHPITMLKKEELAEAYRKESKVVKGTSCEEKAFKLDTEAFIWKKQAFGENDRLTIEIEEITIYDRYLLGDKEKALELQKELITRCEHIFGPDELFSVERYLKLSYMQSDMKNYESALTTDLYILKKLKNILEEDHPHILQIKDNIVGDLADLKVLNKAVEYAYKEAVHRVELLGEHHEETQKMIKMYSVIKSQIQQVVHYFNYHVPNYMGFELQEEKERYVIYYSESEGGTEENKKTAAVSEKNVVDLIHILKPALKWNENYEGKSSFYGEGFELTIHFNDLYIESKGQFAFPDNYQEVHKKVLHWLKQVLH